MSAPQKLDVKTAALAIIGNEILSGRTQDMHTAWIAERLTNNGVLLGEVRIIPDDEALIVSTVNDLRQRYELVLTTGGIGPTHDDITAFCIAKAFGVPLERNEDAYHLLEEHYGVQEMTPPRIKMSMLPKGARLIPNPVTAAPGFVIQNVYVMAGVPRIMQAMFDYILGTVKTDKPILSNTVTCSLMESVLAEDLSQLQDRYPDTQIGSYPHYRGGVLGLSIVIRAIDDSRLEVATKELIELIRAHGDEPRALNIRAGG